MGISLGSGVDSTGEPATRNDTAQSGLDRLLRPCPSAALFLSSPDPDLRSIKRGQHTRLSRPGGAKGL